MNKFCFVLIFLLMQSVQASNNEKPSTEKNNQKEDEEIIGGIGGTGLYDMDRPELIERPELDLDILDDIETSSDSPAMPDMEPPEVDGTPE